MNLEKVLCKFDCNKRDVPILRGRVHLLTLFFYPYAIRTLNMGKIPQELRSSLTIFLVAHLLTIISSTLLHNNQKYIYRSAYKRMDIASIFVTTSSMTLPLDIYYIKEDSVMAIILYIQWILTFIGVFGSLVFDFCCITKEIRSLITMLINAPKIYLIHKVFKRKEHKILLALIISFIMFVTATVIYCKEESNILPGIIGHHELFHLFLSIGFGIVVHINRQLTARFVNCDQLITHF